MINHFSDFSRLRGAVRVFLALHINWDRPIDALVQCLMMARLMIYFKEAQSTDISMETEGH